MPPAATFVVVLTARVLLKYNRRMAVEFSIVSLLSAEPVELAGLPGGRANAATAVEVLLITADGDGVECDVVLLLLMLTPTPPTEAIDTCWACVTDTVIAAAAVALVKF